MEVKICTNCLFCGFKKFDIWAENALSYAIFDKFPVTKFHTLIISKAHYDISFNLPERELLSIFELANQCRKQLISQDSQIKGFNFGANCGEVAGQKIAHVHFHLIPRRKGDIEPPPATP